jgi:hypothetical protein
MDKLTPFYIVEQVSEDLPAEKAEALANLIEEFGKQKFKEGEDIGFCEGLKYPSNL